MPKKLILITGASGFIGKIVVSYLSRKGYPLRVMLRKPHKSFENRGNIEVVYGDMKNYNSVDKATKGVSAVIHLAAAKSDEKDSYEINVIGAINLVKACEKNKVGKIVNISTASTKIRNKGIYASTKEKADEIIMNAEIESVTLKPSVVYGNTEEGVFGSLVKFSKLPMVPVFGSGDSYFSPIYVEDLVKMIEISLVGKKFASKSYDVGGPNNISFNELINLISLRLSKRKARIIHIPIFIGEIIARTLSLFYYKSPITLSNILGSTQEVEFNVGKTFAEFGYIPRSVEEGIEKIREFREEKCGNREIELIYEYITSGAPCTVKVDEKEISRYKEILKNNGLKEKSLSDVVFRFPFLIGSLDLISKLIYPNGTLQKKLYLASMLIECNIASADWLLPKDRSFFDILNQALRNSVSLLIKSLTGISLLFIPGFVRKNAE